MKLKCSRGRHKAEECNLQYKYTKLTSDNSAYKGYFCTTHQQWVSDTCVSGEMTFTFEDGSVVTFELTTNDSGYYNLKLVRGSD